MKQTNYGGGEAVKKNIEKSKDFIIQELFNILVENDVTYAEAQQILNDLRNKLYASAKLG